MTASVNYLGAPEYEKNHENLLRKMIRVISGIMQGKTNNTGTITLTANSATTTLTLAKGRVGQSTGLFLMPTTSNAAGAISGLYISGRSIPNSTMTITHANTATSDRTFTYALIG
jgi:hypothetical protein